MGWMVRELKPGEGDIFRTRPNRLWGFFTIATGSLPHVQSGQVVPLTTHPPLGPRLRKEYSYTFILPLRLKFCTVALNPLAPELFFFLILALPVYKMRIIQEPNKLAL